MSGSPLVRIEYLAIENRMIQDNANSDSAWVLAANIHKIAFPLHKKTQTARLIEISHKTN